MIGFIKVNFSGLLWDFEFDIIFSVSVDFMGIWGYNFLEVLLGNYLIFLVIESWNIGNV